MYDHEHTYMCLSARVLKAIAHSGLECVVSEVQRRRAPVLFGARFPYGYTCRSGLCSQAQLEEDSPGSNVVGLKHMRVWAGRNAAGGPTCCAQHTPLGPALVRDTGRTFVAGGQHLHQRAPGSARVTGAAELQIRLTYVDEVRPVLTGHPKAEVSPKPGLLLYDLQKEAWSLEEGKTGQQRLAHVSEQAPGRQDWSPRPGQNPGS